MPNNHRKNRKTKNVKNLTKQKRIAVCCIAAASALVLLGGGYLIYEKAFNDSKLKTEKLESFEQQSISEAMGDDGTDEIETISVGYKPNDKFEYEFTANDSKAVLSSISVKDNIFSLKYSMTNTSDESLYYDDLYIFVVVDDEGHTSDPVDSSIDESFELKPSETFDFTVTSDVSDFVNHDVLVLAPDKTLIINDNTVYKNNSLTEDNDDMQDDTES